MLKAMAMENQGRSGTVEKSDYRQLDHGPVKRVKTFGKTVHS
jgi:hypothetical protein